MLRLVNMFLLHIVSNEMVNPYELVQLFLKVRIQMLVNASSSLTVQRVIEFEDCPHLTQES